ncbi:MAG TPA: hypothetical protein VGM06_21450 [Polyangiaceae bacterium]|jgi:hypothetical protein
MRPTVPAIAVLAFVAGCHWARPAHDPENTDDSESSSESSDSAKSADTPKGGDTPASDTDTSQGSAMGTTGIGRTGPRAEKATIHDDVEKAAQPCSGVAITDLVASLSQASCELPANAPPAAQPIAKGSLEVTVTPDSTKIAPGATARVTVVFKNKAKTALPLDFTVDPDPRFLFQLYTPGGARIDKPAGAEPALPSEVTSAEAPETRTARITLAPNGTATAVLPWRAVRYRWASKERAKGALPGHGYPREPAGPLGRGKYLLVVVTPLTNIDEGAGREVSHPRAKVEIAGNVYLEPPPPPPPKPAAPSPATPAPAQDSDATIEAKFLKAAGGGSASPPSPPPAKKP